MKRVGSALRHVSMIFIVLNLLSPLSVSYAMAQTLPPATPQEQEAPPPAESQNLETENTAGSTEGQNPAPSQDPAEPVQSNVPAESTGQDPPQETTSPDVPDAAGGDDQIPANPAPVVKTAVTPVLPTVADGYCAADGITMIAASVVAASNTDAIIYTLQGPDASGAFTVVASLVNGEITAWSGDTFANWVDAGNNTVAYSGMVTTIPCPVIEQPTETETPTLTPTDEATETPTETPTETETPTLTPTDEAEETPTETPVEITKVTPQAPIIEDGICKDGEAIDPKVTPATTEGLTYDLTGPDQEGAFTLTATLQDSYAWGDSFQDWSVDGNVATYVKNTATIADCAPKMQARGIGIMSNGDPDTAQYTIQKSVNPTTVAQGMDITYTIVVGWGPEVANTPFIVTDTVPGILTNISGSCGGVIPVGGPTCSGGGNGNNLVWNINPGGYNGEVHLIVTAHVPNGTAGQVVTNYAYVGNAGSKIVAANTFTILDQLPPTIPVFPGTPSVVQGQCTDKGFVAPTLTLPQTEGITYTYSGTVGPNKTVTVIAKLQLGYVWDNDNWPGDWVQIDQVTATFTIKFDNVECATSPVTPETHGAVCTPNGVQKPTITLPNTPGITYTHSAIPDNGGEVTITATLQDHYKWGNTSGWDVNGKTATKKITFKPVSCDKATPTGPGMTQAVCDPVTGIGAPSYTMPSTTGITYSVVSKNVTNGGSITIKATLQDGHYWGNLNGWTKSYDGKSATKTFHFDNVTCKEATPKNPSLNQAVCNPDTGLGNASFTFHNTSQFTYTTNPAGPFSAGQTVTVTATLKQPGNHWGNLTGTGWKLNSAKTAATKDFTFDSVPCTKATPATPTYSQAQCTETGLVQPSITSPANGAIVDGIKYTWDDNDVKNGGTVTITATLQSGSFWGNTDGWSGSGKTRTVKITFENVPCKTATPKVPQYNQAVCTGGELVPPSITSPENGAVVDGIKYTWDASKVVNGGTVTITATLQSGSFWGDTTGWDGSGNIRTKDITFKQKSCAETSPVNPKVTDGICTDGTYTAPVVKTTDGNDITYSISGPNDEGKYTVTATLKDGYMWASDLGDWTRTSKTTATFTTRKVETNECDKVTPVMPVATQAVCQPGGTFSTPTLTPTNNFVDANGITYTYSGTVGIGNTVTITATLPDSGKMWSSHNLGNGWTWKSNTTAEWKVTFTQPNCGTLTPITPTATQAICKPGGSITNPTLTPKNGHVEDSITYTYDDTKVVNNGGTIVITATLSGANQWGDLTGTGWTKDSNDATKATYEVVFDNVECGKVTPATPQVNQAVCQYDGSLTEPSITGLVNSDSITYSWNQADVQNGGSVTITATLHGANEWGDLNGWDKKSDTKATYTIDFENVECKSAQLASPVVNQAVCQAGGEITPPTMAIGGNSASGITYSWDQGKVVNGGTVTITATLAEGYAWGSTSGWSTTDNPREVTRDVHFEDIQCGEVTPVAPFVNEAVCTDGTVTTPSYDKQTTTGIVYTYSEEDLTPGGGVTVTATVQKGYMFGALSNGWKMVEGSTTQATIRVTFENTKCVEVQLANPNITQAVCTGGELHAPSVTVGPSTGVEYVIDPTSGWAPGSAVTITATVQDTYGFPTTLLNGWKMVEGSTSQATYTFTFEQKACEQVIPATPKVTNSVCTGGALTDADLELFETDGITYTTEGTVENGGTVVITATLANGKAWGAMPEGWSQISKTEAQYTVTFEDVQCKQVTPVKPDVTNTVCTEGGLTEPSVTLATTEGIVYTLQGDVVNGGTVFIYAGLQDGYAWETMPEGWIRVERDSAQYKVELDEVNCTDTVPVNPFVVNTVCVEGALTNPDITPLDTEGVVYSFDSNDVVNGGTVVITATIQDSFAWGDLTDSGWTAQNATTATYTVVLDEVECETGTPMTPIVTNSVCVEGGLTVPSVTVISNDDILYSFDEDAVVNGGTVVVTATVQDGYAWEDLTGTGWTKVDDATATYTIQLDNVQCTPVVPVTPAITNGVCAQGGLIKPSVTPAETDGIVYSYNSDDVESGNSVVITATLQAGYAWPTDEATVQAFMAFAVSEDPTWPEGWTRVDATTATFTVDFPESHCQTVVPENPVTTQAVCTDGEVTVPTLETAETDGITYSVDSEGVINGGMAIVTATLADGYEWGTMPEGWTKVDSTTATFTVTFDEVECAPVTPSTPETPKAPESPESSVTNLPTTGAGNIEAASHDLAILMLSTGALALAAIAFGLRRRATS